VRELPCLGEVENGLPFMHCRKKNMTMKAYNASGYYEAWLEGMACCALYLKACTSAGLALS